MIDFIGRRRIYAVFSLLMLIPALIGLAVWQFEPGLDFAGGLESEVRFLRDVEVGEVEDAIAGVPLPDGATTAVRAGDDGEFSVELSLNPPDAEAAQQTGGELLNAITAALGVTDLDDASIAADSARYEIWFAAPTTQDEVRAALETVDLGAARIQATGADSFRIRVEQPEDGDLEGLRTRINDSLRAEIGPIDPPVVLRLRRTLRRNRTGCGHCSGRCRRRDPGLHLARFPPPAQPRALRLCRDRRAAARRHAGRRRVRHRRAGRGPGGQRDVRHRAARDHRLQRQ